MFFPRWSRGAAPLFFLLASTAQAHSVRTDVRIVLETAEVAGLHLELYQDDLAPQLVLENRSGKLLEILDDEGRAFLRIGPREVQGDLAAPAWYRTLNPGITPMPEQFRKATAPVWKTVRREPSFGWFDPRLDPAALKIPPEVKAFDAAVPFAQWRIPTRLGGAPLEFKGSFVYQPPARGMVQARLLQPLAQLAPGITVSLAPGPTPAVFLQNQSKLDIAVLDEKNQPFLRIGPKGVWADTGSAAWRAASGIQRGAESGWKKISTAQSYSWLEPRATYSGSVPSEITRRNQRAVLRHWQVPLLRGDQPLTLSGIVEWVPLPAQK